MKQSFFILSMIILGEKGPGNDIDVYLQPLIKELKKMWEGEETYDASAKQHFLMRAMLMWTINDFPTYSILYGLSTKGAFACPCCVEFTNSKWLVKGGKYSYMGHRKWLPECHYLRLSKLYFDGYEELCVAPISHSGSDILRQLDNLQFTLGKNSKSK